MHDRILVYGATGYTGTLIAEELARIGLRPILAARSADRLAPLARRLGFEWKAFDLDDEDALRHAVGSVQVVLNVAGPYSRTSRPIVDACLANGVHSIDLCGEIAVLDGMSRRDAEAKASGVMLLVGAGFDVVPTDCMIAHLRRRLPSANQVRLFIGGLPILSRGSMRTLLESIGAGVWVRREGELLELERPPYDACDFGDGPRPVVGVSLGDVVTGWWSARVPNIGVYFESSPALERMARAPRWLRLALSTRAGQWVLNRQVDRLPIGPTPEDRKTARTVLIAEASDSAGVVVRSRLETPESYSLSATTAVKIAHQALTGTVRVGFQTPATVHGADFITSIAGVVRKDLV